MTDTDTHSTSLSDGEQTSDDQDVVRINMRLPSQKYEWLMDELDSFTSDTARIQYLIQFYSDFKNTNQLEPADV